MVPNVPIKQEFNQQNVEPQWDAFAWGSPPPHTMQGLLSFFSGQYGIGLLLHPASLSYLLPDNVYHAQLLLPTIKSHAYSSSFGAPLVSSLLWFWFYTNDL